MDEHIIIKSTLDIREVPPRERHPMIFQLFDELEAGEGFVLVNDHEPRPLYYQFLMERTNQFEWRYLETNQGVWRVLIARRAVGE